MSSSEDRLGEALKALVQAIKMDSDIPSLDHYRRIFRKNVPFFLRAYAAAYLIRHLDRSKKLEEFLNSSLANANSKVEKEAPRVLKEPLTLFFGAGRSRRVNAREITKLLIQQAGISKEQLGDIKVLDNYSFVDVEKKVAEQVIKKMEGFQLKGRPLKVNYAKKKEGG